MTLDEIGLLHGADKASHAHDYLTFYEEILLNMQLDEPEPIKLLEIGVDGGASMRMWLDWLPISARVYGLDHNLKWTFEDPRLCLVQGDVTDLGFMASFCREHGPWNVILDDGGHHTGQKIAALEMLWPSLRHGGLYIIEDGHVDYDPRWTNEGKDRFIPWIVKQIEQHVDEEGRLLMGRRLPLNECIHGPIPGVDTVTFRKSVIALRKRAL